MGRLVRIRKNDNGTLESEDNSNVDMTLETNLVYDSETKVVYYMFDQYRIVPPNRSALIVGYMSPYIGPNGKFCKLRANEIVEIG